MTIVLTDSDVRRLLSMAELIEVMARALADFSSGRVLQPVRTVIPVRSERNFFGVMPAFLEAGGVLGAKLVTAFPGNASLGVETHMATILLLDPETGALKAIINGATLTAMRTAAASAVSAREVARPGADILAVIGSGVQARSHVAALQCDRRFREIRVWSPAADRRNRFAAEAGARAVESAEAAVGDAGIIVLATSAVEPVLQKHWVRPGAHVIAVGACRPSQREIDPRLIAHSRLFVDSKAAALKESGDIVMSHATIAGELGEVIERRVEGRQSADQITIFKSLGLAVEDLAAANLVYRRALQEGVGTHLRL